MAGKQNPQKKVIHRQTFQNSNQMVELTVKTIPKNLHNEASKSHSSFVRDCALRKEIQKVVDDKNNNISTKGIRKMNSERYANEKGRTKVSKGRVTVEVVKNKSNRDQHEIVSHNSTWEEMLHSCSTILSSSNSDKSEDSSILEIPNKFRNSENSIRPLTKNKDEHLERLARKAQIHRQKQQNQSVQTSFVNAPPQDTKNFQQGDVRNIQEEPFQLQNNKSKKTRSVAVEVHSDEIRSSIQRDQLQGSGMRRAPSMHTQQEQISNRLLSDDVNNSPFGESALHLLHQLRERLQSRGDNEGSDMVGVLEAFIGMHGSTGSVGSGNPGFQTLNASPLYTTVFQTPVDQANYKTNQERNIRHQPVKQDVDKTSARLQRHAVHPVIEHQSSSANPAQSKKNEQESKKESEESEKTLDKLKRVIEHQRKVILEQENNIDELRTLSTRILSQKEEFLQAAQSNQELVEMQSNSNKDSVGNPNTRNQDSGYGLEDTERSAHPMQVTDIAVCKESDNVKTKQRNTDKELKSSLLQLQTENQILRKEVQDNRDLILNLENQLTRTYREIESERQSRCGLSLSRLSGSVPNLDIMSNRVEPMSTKREHHKPPSSVLGESEADSAYEEKSGSHLTSKLNSPHMDGQQGKDSRNGLAMACPLQQQEPSENAKENDIPVDTVLLRTGHIGKEATVPAALMSAATVPSSEIVSHVNVGGVQRNNASRAANSDTVPNKDISHQQVVYPKSHLRNSQKPSQANRGFHTLGLKVSDLEPVPVVVLEDPTFTSFSTVSELSHQESVTCEKSFLQGITVSRQSSKPSSRVTSPVNLEHVDHSLTKLHPLESTRVKDSSHTLSESQEFVALKGNETSTSSEFNSVEELE